MRSVLASRACFLLLALALPALAPGGPRVLREGTRLFYEFNGLRKEMYPQSPTPFIGIDGSRFSFARDDAGRYVVILGTGASAVAAVKQ